MNVALSGTRIASPRAQQKIVSPFDVTPKVTCCPAWSSNYLTFVVAPCVIAGAHCDLGLTLSPSSDYPFTLSVMRTLSAPAPQNRHSNMQRNRFTQTITLGDRLAHEAELLRQQARTVPVGKERQSLLRKARQLETASHINEWLSSPGLQTPQ
jgi:hypothetical protein